MDEWIWMEMNRWIWRNGCIGGWMDMDDEWMGMDDRWVDGNGCRKRDGYMDGDE